MEEVELYFIEDLKFIRSWNAFDFIVRNMSMMYDSEKYKIVFNHWCKRR